MTLFSPSPFLLSLPSLSPHNTRYLFQGSAEPQFEEVCNNGTPVLLLWGKDDVSVPYAHCEQLAEVAHRCGAVTGSTVWVEGLDGIPHNVFHEEGGPRCREVMVDFADEAAHGSSETPRHLE